MSLSEGFLSYFSSLEDPRTQDRSLALLLTSSTVNTGFRTAADLLMGG